MTYPQLPVWKEAPFIRLLVPFVAGIIMEWYLGVPLWIYISVIAATSILILLFSFAPSFTKFKNYWLTGALIIFMMAALAGVLTYHKDTRHDKDCITNIHQKNITCVVTLREPLSEKENSFKATTGVDRLYMGDTMITSSGNIIVYFQKDSSLTKLGYNKKIVFNKTLQPVKNSGNPGAFDYKRYCIFQQIYYQVYLKPTDYIVLPGREDNTLTGALFNVRKKLITILKAFIPGEKESGLAEALLIGYKDDLDKGLVQSYSNTGVVHIIAISGLHLGLIYWLFNLVLSPLKTDRKTRWLKAILVISGLWLFSLLTGGSASVCRSALMFTFIVAGENIGRKTNTYNSLAGSAFLLLCYNPYWLWDAGFQLSYIAVLSIVVFMKPVYNLFYIKNKLLDTIWKMAAISIAAQMLTTPVSIYHFKQFPNYFLVTNVVAVPLSSVIVLAEIALCMSSFIPSFAATLGKLTVWLIKIMNDFIDYINTMPMVVTANLTLSLAELILAYLIVITAAVWIFKKNKLAFISALCFIFFFSMMKSLHAIQIRSQKKLIVYNIGRQLAIDIIKGDQCIFLAEETLSYNQAAENFTLKPSRNDNGVKQVRRLQLGERVLRMLKLGGKKLLIVKGEVNPVDIPEGYDADIIILSGNPGFTIGELQGKLHCRMVVFDSSNAKWKIDRWITDCRKANLLFHSVAENGAFILNLN